MAHGHGFKSMSPAPRDLESLSDLRHMIVLEYILQARGDELVIDRRARRRFEISLLGPQVIGRPRRSASSAEAADMLSRMPTAFCTFSVASNWREAKSRP